jgi:hypothetical protein
MEWSPEEQGLSYLYAPGAYQRNYLNAFSLVRGEGVSFQQRNLRPLNESVERPVSAFDDEQLPWEGSQMEVNSNRGAPMYYDEANVVTFEPVMSGTPPHLKGKSATKKVKKTKPSSTTPRVRRPLSAYNLFFRDERERLLAVLPVRKEGKPRRSHGKLGFVAMAKDIGAKWRSLDAATKDHYVALAAKDKERYNREKEQIKQRQVEGKSLQTTEEKCTTQVEDEECLKLHSDSQAPLPMNEVWSLHELAERLGPDGVSMMIRSFR